MYVYRHRTFSRAPFGIFIAIAAMLLFLAGCSPAPSGGSADSSAASASSIATTIDGPSVYFSRVEEDPAQDCGEVYPVARAVTNAADEGRELMAHLFAGPTDVEIQNGYRSFFSSATATALKDYFVKNGTAYVNLEDIRSAIPNASSSCGSAALLAQIDSTLKQVPGVTRVILAIDGSTQDFYDWLQLGCSDQNDQCDDAAFKERGSASSR